MQIRPADLGSSRALALIEQRARAHNESMAARRGGRGGLLRQAWHAPNPSAAKRPLGLVGRFWARGSGLNDAEAAEALARMGPSVAGLTAGMGSMSAVLLGAGAMIAVQGHTGVAGILAAQVAVLGGMAFFLPRRMLHRLHGTPVSAQEIDALVSRSETGDALERSYLTLVRDALRHGDIPEEAEADIRAAIRALGDALDRLPPLTATSADAEALRRGAAEARGRAAAEPDRVIAASVERRADALERSADATERSSLLLRRTTALREELAAQTESLRLGLASLYSGAGDVADLSHLSEAVRGVAAEATSVADARAEIDGAIPSGSWGTTSAPADAQPLHAGAGRTP